MTAMEQLSIGNRWLMGGNWLVSDASGPVEVLVKIWDSGLRLKKMYREAEDLISIGIKVPDRKSSTAESTFIKLGSISEMIDGWTWSVREAGNIQVLYMHCIISVWNAVIALTLFLSCNFLLRSVVITRTSINNSLDFWNHIIPFKFYVYYPTKGCTRQ